MYLSETTTGRKMGSLRRDYVTRIPIDLDRAPVSGFKSTSSLPIGTSRVLINNSNPSNAISSVRSRIDSEKTFAGMESDRQPDSFAVKMDTPVGFDGPRKWSSVSSSTQARETGSILKKSESGGGGGSSSSSNSQTLGSNRAERTPQGRRRVRFTNNVAMYRFDSDGVDSTYSSSEYERLNVDPTDHKRSNTSNGKYSTLSIPGNTSRVKVSTDDYDSGQRNSSGIRRTLDDRVSHFPGQQQYRSTRILHGTPSGSLYLRNGFDRVRSMPSVHWLESSPKLSHQAGSSSTTSGSVKSTSYALVSDSVTREKKLIISAKLSETIQPNDITIKANKNGSKIRIVSSKSPPVMHHQSNALAQSNRQQINEQILLPVHVDPYRLTARLEPNGSLHIEAPYVN